MNTSTAAPDLEQAFSLIEQGNGSEEKHDYWEAADAFAKATEILQRLSDDIHEQLVQNGDSSEEKEKSNIALLYGQQSREYLHKARDCLILAMRQENDRDRDDMSANQEQEEPLLPPSPSYQSLSKEDAEKRLFIFKRLFSKGELNIASLPSDAATEDEKPVQEQQLSLEERMMQLNENLPSGFKTSDQRMRDINRGLSRLGLSLYSAADRPPPFSSHTIEAPKSEGEQVDEIIQQAHDEVSMQQISSTAETGEKAKSSSVLDSLAEEVGDSLLMRNEEELEDLDDSNSSNEDDDNDLAAGDFMEIQDNIVEAQAKLAQLIALMELDEDEDDAEIKFDQCHGKKLLKESRTLLLQATKRWDES